MTGHARGKLSVMMFLEYVIWGAWLPLLSDYLKDGLGFSGIQIAWIQNTFAIASLTAMLIGGQLADRYLAMEKFLAVSHLVGGITMLLLPWQTNFWIFLGLMLVHCFFYVPTLSITNALCFANLEDAKRDFGFVRLWGTIGWIAASWPFVILLEGKKGEALSQAQTSIFIVAGIASLVLAAYSLTLPHTPPSKAESTTNAPLETLRLLAVPSIAVLFVVTFLDSLVHYCYFFWTAPYLKSIQVKPNWIMPAMSIGQIAEILTMAVLGYTLKSLGWRLTMVIGILGHAVRFLIYSIGSPDLAWLVIASNVVHGFCYAFFFAAVYIYVDEQFPKDVRTSAQSLLNLLVLGLGPFLGNFLWGGLGDFLSTKVTTDGQEVTQIAFNKLFLVPAGIAVVAALLFIVSFKPAAAPPAPPKSEEEAPAQFDPTAE